jgi:hypothetical protein
VGLREGVHPDIGENEDSEGREEKTSVFVDASEDAVRRR